MINSAGDGTMHLWTCWQACSAGFVVVLAGCGQAQSPQAPSGDAPPAATSAASPASAPAVAEPLAAKDQAATAPAAQPASPASLAEATRAIDLRKFPLPDGGRDLYKSAAAGEPRSGKDLYKSASALSFVLRRSGGAEVAQFCRARLSEAGWKLSDKPAGKDYFEFTGFKQGFLLSGAVYENRAAGELGVSITNHGNIDSRTLPRLAEVELKDNDAGRTIYLTNATPDAVLEFIRAELKKGGWREVRDQTGIIDMEPGFPVILRFIQRGVEITTSVQAKTGKTEVWNKVRLLDVELPIMPEAKGVVQFQGNSDNVHLFYAMPTTGPEKVLEFYRQELPALGWTMRAGSDKIEDGKAKVILESPQREPLRLELLADKQGTAVLIAALPPN
jgi:hypothetical protein